ncbi:hypothetical protein [Brevibacterium siliguriense]|uniref:hypothetical protein n=1 Tax=Brevibacterium siliguriense TaxID=1136497 RepID=UPI002F91123F
MLAHPLGHGLGLGLGSGIANDLDEGFGILGERVGEMIAGPAETERPLFEEACADLGQLRMPGVRGLPQLGQ